VPAAGRGGAPPGARWGGMERRIRWNLEPNWRNRGPGCGAGQPHVGVGRAPHRARGGFPRVLWAFRAHHFGDHHSGDRLTILVRPVLHAWSDHPSAGRLWPRRRYQPGVVRNWGKHWKISRKKRHNSTGRKSLGDRPFPRGRRSGQGKNIESGQPPDDLRPRSTAPPAFIATRNGQPALFARGTHFFRRNANGNLHHGTPPRSQRLRHQSPTGESQHPRADEGEDMHVACQMTTRPRFLVKRPVRPGF
jgi:hypothetical protein